MHRFASLTSFSSLRINNAIRSVCACFVTKYLAYRLWLEKSRQFCSTVIATGLVRVDIGWYIGVRLCEWRVGSLGDYLRVRSVARILALAPWAPLTWRGGTGEEDEDEVAGDVVARTALEPGAFPEASPRPAVLWILLVLSSTSPDLEADESRRAAAESPTAGWRWGFFHPIPSAGLFFLEAAEAGCTLTPRPRCSCTLTPHKQRRVHFTKSRGDAVPR